MLVTMVAQTALSSLSSKSPLVEYPGLGAPWHFLLCLTCSVRTCSARSLGLGARPTTEPSLKSMGWNAHGLRPAWDGIALIVPWKPVIDLGWV